MVVTADVTWIGRVLELRQRNDTNVISVGGYENLQRQKVIVTGVNQGTNLTIWPPLHWTLKPVLSPTWGVETIWMARFVGIEDLVIEATNSWSGAAPASIGPGYGCWFKNVRVNHAANLNLYEGNVASKFQCDGYFGGASDDTLFRNWFHGTCPGQDQNGQCINLNRFSYRYTILGNVLGTTNLVFLYDNATNGFNYRDRYIYSFGLPNMGNGGFNGRFGPPWSNERVSPGPSGFQEIDTNVVSTVIRKGNFNYATASVPAAESLRGNSLPDSLYLTGKPGWWGSNHWPAFGPDLDPKIGTIPAQLRWAQMEK